MPASVGAWPERFQVVETYDGFLWPYVSFEIANNSPRTYWDVSFCGIFHDPDGTVGAVERASLFPDSLDPGQKGTVPVYMSPMLAGSVDLFASGHNYPGEPFVLDPSHFHLTAKKIVTGDQGRELHVVGEVKNSTGKDLSNVQFEAYADGSRGNWTWADVGWLGEVPKDVTVPVSFSIPLRPDDDSDNVMITGMEAREGLFNYPLAEFDVTSAVNGDSVRVSATLVNPGDLLVQPYAVRFNLRSTNGTLIGSTIKSLVDSNVMNPGDKLLVSGDVMSLAPGTNVARVEVIAYSHVVPD